jgi:hypothetical protein
MNTLDNLLLQKVGSYLDHENCCVQGSLHNWGVTNKATHAFVQKHFKMKNHKQMRFKKHNSVLRWRCPDVCTRCFPLSCEEVRELVHLKGCAYHHDEDEIGLFRSMFERKKDIEKRKTKMKSGYIYIHFNTQKEVLDFSSKLPKLLYNVQSTNEYCCDGKGTRVMIHY